MSLENARFEDHHDHDHDHDHDYDQLQQRENDIKELLLEWKELVLSHSKTLAETCWRTLRIVIISSGIKCSEEEVRIIMEDIVATSEHCVRFDMDRTRRYLDWAYDFYFPATRIADIRKDFQDTLWEKERLLYSWMHDLKLKDIMAYVSIYFYDGIALLFTDNPKPSLDENEDRSWIIVDGRRCRRGVVRNKMK